MLFAASALVRRSSATIGLLLGAFLAVPGTARAQRTTTPDLDSVCGDGIVQFGEECDDANQDDADGCLRTCLLPARFVASDPHIHSNGCGGSMTPADLLELSAANGTEVSAALVWGDGFAEDRRYFTGRDHAASSPGKIIHYDLEVSHFPSAKTGGHLVLLGLDSIDFSRDPFNSPRGGIAVLSWALAQGSRVVAGMAHGEFWPADGSFPTPPAGCCTAWDFVVEAIRGRLHFLETERRNGGSPLDPGTQRLWRSVLNAGARVAIAGASDYPCLHHSLDNDTPRTDAIFDGPLTYDHWLDAMRQGQTAVAVGRGNHLNLRVDGKGVGSEVSIAAGDVVRLSLEGAGRVPYTVQILANGVPVGDVHFGAGSQAAAVDLRLQKSAWIAASSPWVTTSPVYVVADGLPIRGAPADICYLMRYVDHLTRLVKNRSLNVGDELDETLAYYADARALLATRFGEAGGTTCP